MNKKTKILLLIICLMAIVGIVLFLIFGLGSSDEFDPDDYKEPIELTKINFLTKKIEVYDDVKLSDVIELKNDLELLYDYQINTDELGSTKLYIKYKENGEVYKNYTSIKIVDTTPPYIGVSGSYSHIVDTNFTFNSDVICADNYDKHVECNIVGEYDLTTIGESNVKVVAEDSSGNITEKNMVLKVIEKPKASSGGGNTTVNYKKLEDIIDKMPSDATLMIDVSKWQADIDWGKVKESGINYAMIRIGSQKAIDKESVLDTYFEKNIEEAQKNGIKVGVYYYSYANDVEDAEEQAKWVLEQLKGYKLDLPVAFDWECWKYFNSFNISIHDLNVIAKTFLSKIEEAGYDTVNYGSKNYLETFWDLKGYKTWLAHYTDYTNYSKDFLMWQFTNIGTVPGINGAVDVNYYYEDN